MVKLFVGNLSPTTNASRLHREFGAFGKVTNVFIPMEPVEKQNEEMEPDKKQNKGMEPRKKQNKGMEPVKKQNKGFGFVTFMDRASAEEAISKMDRSMLDGRKLRVNESKPRGASMASRPVTPSDGTVSVASGPSTSSNASSRRRP